MSIIEFVGPPGSGKTFQSLSLINEHTNHLPGRRSLCVQSGNKIFPLLKKLIRLQILQDIFLALLGSLGSAIYFLIYSNGNIYYRLIYTKKLFIISFQRFILLFSDEIWVLDQSSHQLLLDAVVDKFLTSERFHRISKLFFTPNCRVCLKPLAVRLDVLINQIKISPKHVRQSVKYSDVSNYASLYLSSFSKLFSDYQW